jgi:phospho-N-acetylmuramoyl-pentapeptide-transferase
MVNAPSSAPNGHLSALVAVLSLLLFSTSADLYWGYRDFTGQILPWWLVCFTIVGIAGKFCVPLLRAIKAGQFIREDGPQSHLQKSGTPTMGGIYVIPVGVGAALLSSGMAEQVWAASGLTVGFGLVGWWDDWQILRKKSNKGLSPKMKLILQGLLALVFCGWLTLTRSWLDLTTIDLPFGWVLPLGIFFFPLALFVILGSTNATNLTDGLDGLAAGTGAIALMGMALLIFPKDQALAKFCACMAGSYLGFLWHNRHPAQVFMGDTGSLALGGALAAIALIANMLWGLLVVGLLFVWESISVIAQVSYYKATKNEQGVGKRLFKMAPYHHHLELSGWHETKIVLVFYGVAIGLVWMAIVLLQFG